MRILPILLALSLVAPGAAAQTAKPKAAVKPPAAAQAKAPAPPARDAWGLTPRDWLMKPPAELRAAAGFPLAAPRVLAAAQAGDAKAAALIAGAYAVGAGVPVNDAEGARWARFAADRGVPLGQFALAQRYRDGNGVQNDLRQMGAWMRKAADQGHTPAKIDLATLPPSLEVREIYPGWIASREMLREVAAAGDTKVQPFLRMYDTNERLSKVLSGMPIWKDGEHLVGWHAEYAMPMHPCTTMIRSEKGSVWTIVWAGMKVYRPQATSIVFEGPVMKENPLFVSINSNSVPLTRLLGFVLLENNRSHSPEETRRIYESIELDALRLIGDCNALARGDFKR